MLLHVDTNGFDDLYDFNDFNEINLKESLLKFISKVFKLIDDLFKEFKQKNHSRSSSEIQIFNEKLSDYFKSNKRNVDDEHFFIEMLEKFENDSVVLFLIGKGENELLKKFTLSLIHYIASDCAVAQLSDLKKSFYVDKINLVLDFAKNNNVIFSKMQLDTIKKNKKYNDVLMDLSSSENISQDLKFQYESLCLENNHLTAYKRLVTKIINEDPVDVKESIERISELLFDIDVKFSLLNSKEILDYYDQLILNNKLRKIRACNNPRAEGEIKNLCAIRQPSLYRQTLDELLVRFQPNNQEGNGLIGNLYYIQACIDLLEFHFDKIKNGELQKRLLFKEKQKQVKFKHEIMLEQLKKVIEINVMEHKFPVEGGFFSGKNIKIESCEYNVPHAIAFVWECLNNEFPYQDANKNEELFKNIKQKTFNAIDQSGENKKPKNRNEYVDIFCKTIANIKDEEVFLRSLIDSILNSMNDKLNFCFKKNKINKGVFDEICGSLAKVFLSEDDISFISHAECFFNLIHGEKGSLSGIPEVVYLNQMLGFNINLFRDQCNVINDSLKVHHRIEDERANDSILATNCRF